MCLCVLDREKKKGGEKGRERERERERENERKNERKRMKKIKTFGGKSRDKTREIKRVCD